MARILGNGPIAISSKGRQLLVPLTSLRFDSGGAVQVDWPPFSDLPDGDQGALKELLRSLVSQGLLDADSTAPPTPALVIEAADAGVAGNHIQVRFSNFTPDAAHPLDATKTRFDVT